MKKMLDFLRQQMIPCTYH